MLQRTLIVFKSALTLETSQRSLIFFQSALIWGIPMHFEKKRKFFCMAGFIFLV